MIRLGLIGYGKAGQAVAAVLNDDPRFDLRWIARRSTQREAEGLRSVILDGNTFPIGWINIQSTRSLISRMRMPFSATAKPCASAASG